MNLKNKIILNTLFFLVLLFYLPKLSDLTQNNPFFILKTLSTSVSQPDLTFLDKSNPHLKNLINFTRAQKTSYFVPPYDAYIEQLVIEHSDPSKFLATSDNKISVVGPNPQTTEIVTTHTSLDRWLRMFLTLACWFGISFFIPNLSFVFRIFSGVLIYGWSTLYFSYFLNLSLHELYYFYVPLSIFGLFYMFHKKNFSLKSFRLLFVFICILFFIHSFWLPFFTNDFSAHDSRIMWFYRYKFEYLLGFNPKTIALHMSAGSQRDYSWFLGGALSLSSWLDSSSYLGWFENAAYGSLVWILFSIQFLWIKIFKNHNILFQIAAVTIPFATFYNFITNGYMDIYWASTFTLFLLGYYQLEFKKYQPAFSEFELFILLFLTVSFKNEGLAAFYFFIIFECIRSIKKSKFIQFVFGKVCFYGLVILPTIFQKYLLTRVGIFDQYQLGKRIFEISPYHAIKSFESVLRYICKHLIFERPQYSVIIFFLFLLLFLEKKFKSILVFLGLLLYYSLPALIIYTYTRADQYWQLETSMYRVFMFWVFFGMAFIAWNKDNLRFTRV